MESQVLMYLDKTVGMLVEYLETEGWMENSIIVVASDNGGCPAKGGSNYPLRGIKHTYWEGGVKARKPGVFHVGKRLLLLCVAVRNMGFACAKGVYAFFFRLRETAVSCF